MTLTIAPSSTEFKRRIAAQSKNNNLKNQITADDWTPQNTLARAPTGSVPVTHTSIRQIRDETVFPRRCAFQQGKRTRASDLLAVPVTHGATPCPASHFIGNAWQVNARPTQFDKTLGSLIRRWLRGATSRGPSHVGSLTSLGHVQGGSAPNRPRTACRLSGSAHTRSKAPAPITHGDPLALRSSARTDD